MADIKHVPGQPTVQNRAPAATTKGGPAARVSLQKDGLAEATNKAALGPTKDKHKLDKGILPGLDKDFEMQDAEAGASAISSMVSRETPDGKPVLDLSVAGLMSGHAEVSELEAAEALGNISAGGTFKEHEELANRRDEQMRRNSHMEAASNAGDTETHQKLLSEHTAVLHSRVNSTQAAEAATFLKLDGADGQKPEDLHIANNFAYISQMNNGGGALLKAIYGFQEILKLQSAAPSKNASLPMSAIAGQMMGRGGPPGGGGVPPSITGRFGGNNE